MEKPFATLVMNLWVLILLTSLQHLQQKMTSLLSQLRIAEKSNEITAIPQLLQTSKIKGCIFTIDAMGCQRAIVTKIHDQNGDYILGLKGNQGTPHDEAVKFFDRL